MKWTVNTDAGLSKFLGDVRELYAQHRYLKASVKTGKDRSLDQNSISHAWYNQIALELKEDDALGHKCYCKLHHGVPILRAEDEEFKEVYDKAIKGLSYEQKLLIMRFLPVTSRMTKPQLSKYLESIQADFMTRGVKLEFPEELRNAQNQRVIK